MKVPTRKLKKDKSDLELEKQSSKLKVHTNSTTRGFLKTMTKSLRYHNGILENHN